MENVRAFKVVFIGQTNTTPSYIKLDDLRNRLSVKLSTSNTSYSDASDIAEEYLNSIGISILGRAENNNKGYILFTNNFETQIK
jgi:hypothetical protein